MSFSPSATFEKRWLESPNEMKRIIARELSDIIALLKDDTKLDNFAFFTPNLHEKLSALQSAHLIDMQKRAEQARAKKADALIPLLENRLEEQILLRMGQLSDELKIWLRQAIQDELRKQDDF